MNRGWAVEHWVVARWLGWWYANSPLLVSRYVVLVAMGINVPLASDEMRAPFGCG